jgi:hypothetical protein
MAALVKGDRLEPVWKNPGTRREDPLEMQKQSGIPGSPLETETVTQIAR